MTIKKFLFQALVGTVAAPVIMTGNAMIATGNAITTGGHITKEFGEEKTVKWMTGAAIAEHQAIAAKQVAEQKKDATKLRRHQLKVERLERELNREQEAFRASGMVFEAELA